MKAKQCISSIARTATEKLFSLNRHLSELNRSKHYSDVRLRPPHALRHHHGLHQPPRCCRFGGPDTRPRRPYGPRGLPSLLYSALLSLDSKAGVLNAVKRVFEEIENPDVYSRTTLLSACAKLGEFEHACQLRRNAQARCGSGH